jgi:biotin carboxylase
VKKTILIIGAGFGQLPAINKAREMGLTVVAIDRNPDALGMKLADYAYTIDVVDVKGAIEIARKHQIDGVLTLQTDLPVPTVGAVVDALNLNGSGLEVAEKCSNKIKTRLAFKEAGVPQPCFEIVRTYEEAKVAAQKIGYPCIIKSADSSGSRGVTKVRIESEIDHALQEAFKYSRLNEILVEEYISGKEIGAQCFSINGKCSCVLVHNDTLSDPPYMIPVGHSFPIVGFTDDELSQIEDDIKRAVDVLGIKDGPSNIDLIVDSRDNTVKIIEVGARIGATCLPELVFYHSGIDWVEQAINSCLNLSVNLKKIKNQPVTAFILQSPKDGKLSSYNVPNEIINNPDVKEVEITASIGDELQILRKGTDRIGKIIVTNNTVEGADDLAKNLISKINIVVQ